MRTVWNRIERALAQASPSLLADLRPPVTDADLRLLHESASVRLPEDVIQSLQVHDGQLGGAAPLFGSYQLYSASHAARVLRILDTRTESAGIDASGRIIRIRPIRWAHGWIPVAGNGVGQCYCVDMNPGKAGAVGQVIRVDGAGPMREWIALSLRAWLADFAARLENGRLEFDPRWGLLDAGTADHRFCADWGGRE